MQKPITKDPRQDDEEVKEWKEQRLPELKKEAKEEGKVICYADESSFFLNPNFYHTYAPKGNPPTVNTWDKSFKHIAVCAAISHHGDFTCTMSDEPYVGEKIVEFLKELLKQIPQPIILIWDGASIHHCQAVKDYLDTLDEGRLKLVRQPSYSPELNASEQVWNYAKNVDLKNQVFKTVSSLKKAVQKTLDKFSERAKLILQFFQEPNVAFY